MDLVGLVIADTALLLALDMSTALLIWMTGSMTVVPPPPPPQPLLLFLMCYVWRLLDTCIYCL